MSSYDNPATAQWILSRHYDRISEKIVRDRGDLLDLSREVRFVKVIANAFLGKNGKTPDDRWAKESLCILKRPFARTDFQQMAQLEKDWDLFELATERFVACDIIVRGAAGYDTPEQD